jgi:hypothetical protein
VTIFGRRVLSTWGQPTRLASAIPACVVAAGGPAPGLADRVRHYGASHTGYDAFIEREIKRELGEILDEDQDDVRVRRRPEDGEETGFQ